MKKILTPVALFLMVVFSVLLMILLVKNQYEFKIVSNISDYDNYLNSLEQYGKEPPPIIKDDLPAIKEFSPLVEKYFDYGANFNGNLTYVSHSMQNYLLELDGKLTKIENDLRNHTLVNEKYAFINSATQKYGIKDIFGNTLIEPIYDSYQIENDTILMTKNNNASIFKNEKLISTSQFSYSVSLYDDSTILKDYALYDIYFDKLMYKGHKIISPLVENMRIFVTENNLCGYISSDEKILIEPKFSIANNFVNGYARVKIGENDAIINSYGENIFEYSGIIVNDYYDGYFCFTQNNKLGVMDSNFNIVVKSVFENIKMNRAYGDFLIDNLTNQFYSIKTRLYDARTFKKIIPYKNYFICQNNNDKFCLLNKNLEALVDGYDNISYAKTILMLQKDGKYSYYKNDLLKNSHKI